ncbi:MAG: hypothetical protein OEQ16_01395 [Gammaproteobacteria bacterium]|jgi:hypothetical protein|nr:hypothetical protein [Gammaproteobacteria bacterium]MDH3820502.1 hypothetical protein [Gammaproteobacteria bacterium]
MKYVVALVLGLIIGAAILAVGVVYNPFTVDRVLSPLSVTEAQVIVLKFSRVPAESLVYTNNGDSVPSPYPEKVLQLWEAPIRKTSAMATVMRDARNQPAGIGIKISSLSESTHLLRGEAIVDSIWYVYAPQHGSMFIQQTENYLPFVREVAFPAWKSAANSWRGTWMGNMTSGPGALGIAAVSGGSGRVKGLDLDGVETLSVRAFSADAGFVAAEGQLLIELPDPSDDEEDVLVR